MGEFWARLGAIKIVEPLTKRAFKVVEERRWRGRVDNRPHGEEWHTSFHASQFPGADERACGRALQYVLMDDPGKEPPSRRLRGQGEMGQAIEDMLVERWGEYGVLLPPAEGMKQISVQDDDHWLTGSMDAPIVPEGWTRPHVVDVKSKAADVIRQMQAGERGPDPKHVKQIKTYITRTHEEAHRWPHLEPCRDGSLYYVSRDDPEQTHEFFFTHDDNHMRRGREVLAEARDAYLRGELLPHPFGGREWSIDPCKYCDFKKHSCKPDDKAGVTKLRESHSVAHANEVYGDDNYDYDETRQRVLARWQADDMEEVPEA